MKDKEALAFDLWKSPAPDSFKRAVILELYYLIKSHHNQTFSKVFYELNRRLPNVTESDMMDAITSLKQFNAVGMHPFTGKGKDKRYAFHINFARSELFDKYLDYIEQNYPHLL